VTEVIVQTDVAAQVIAVSSGLRRALKRRADRGQTISSLSDAQRELVRTVSRHPGIRVGEAADELHLAANTVSTLVSSLVTVGCMRRETDPGDGRSVLLFLTPDMDRRVEEWRDRRLAVLTEALQTLSGEDQGRIASALPALQQLVEQVREGEDGTGTR
jgi:DNA-binding MarR family transcriptional regulator